MKTTINFFDLKDKHVFITGGGSGIGAALTTGFLSQFAKVSFVQRSEANDFVRSMNDEYQTQCLGLQCDITNLDGLKNAIAKAQDKLGNIDILINNAGNDEAHDLMLSPQGWEDNMSINLRPYFFATQFVAEQMKIRKYGVVINLVSASYKTGGIGYPAYVAANAGIVGLTRALARELGPYQIRVNALVSGLIMTDKKREDPNSPESLNTHLANQCLKDYLTPKDVIEPALFLASKASRMMTGQTLIVDGGSVFGG